jgi:hypothetical protein
MALDLAAYRRQLERLGRGERLPEAPDRDPDAARQARLQAAHDAEEARLKRVQELAPKAKKLARELAALNKRYETAEAAAAAAIQARDELYVEQMMLGNRIARLEYGDDI